MRSAAPPNSEGSEDAFSKAWVPYSLPSDRRQKAAKKSLICHFFCPAPHLFAIDAISNALTAQQCGTGEQFGWSQIWMSQEVAARRRREGVREHNARTRAAVSNKFQDFSKRFPTGLPRAASPP
jgi:hypothetical protein